MMLNPKQFLHRGPKYVRQNFGTKKVAKKKLKQITVELKNKVDDFYEVEANLDKVREALDVITGEARLAKLRAQELELAMRERALIVLIEQMREEEEMLMIILMDD
jgi:hypothetical protein